jgi:hypothetical protein
VVGYLAVREPGPTVLDRIERTLRSAIFAETEREVVLEAVERATDLPASRRRRLLALVSESHPDPDVRSLAADLAREGI